MVRCLFSLYFFLSVAGLVSSIRLSSQSNILSENLLEIARHPCSSNTTKNYPKAAQSGPVECNDRKVKVSYTLLSHFYFVIFRFFLATIFASRCFVFFCIKLMKLQKKAAKKKVPPPPKKKGQKKEKKKTGRTRV